MTQPAATPPPIVFADSETTHLDSRRRLAWDVALIRRRHTPDGFEETETQFYVEVDLREADPFALAVGRFYDRHPLGRVISGRQRRLPDPLQPLSTGGWVIDPGQGDYLSAAAAAMAIARITHGAHIVGAIPSFETITFEPALRDVGLTPGWHYHIIDIEALMVGWLLGRASKDAHGATDPRVASLAPPWKSDDLSAMCGVEPLAEAERHTALGDARWAQRVYDKVMGTVSC